MFRQWLNILVVCSIQILTLKTKQRLKMISDKHKRTYKGLMTSSQRQSVLSRGLYPGVASKSILIYHKNSVLKGVQRRPSRTSSLTLLPNIR